jgi:hypothetical protein
MTLQRFFRWSAAAVALACLAPAVAGDNVEMAAPVKLRFEPRFILDTVAERMEVKLRADVPLPAIFLESTTPLRQFQDAMEGQWQFRPPLIANSYSIATNEIYLSDEASFYRRFKRTLDDSLAHEFVHYIQARYHGEDLTHDGCELQAAEIQRWFRDEYVQPLRDVGVQEAGAGERLSSEGTPACTVVLGVDGIRTVRCPTGARPPQG